MAVEMKELGTLIVVVGKARNLPNKSRFGKQDPFCTVTISEEKQKTKAVKRGGQHPEWDEELRFVIHEDVDDVLVRSESQPDSLTSSLSSKPSTSLSGNPALPPKDLVAPGAITPAALANKSRKGPLNKKGGKSMRVACFADDAKEPELIGECTVPIEEVLKKGEVDEWYEFSYKDKYSGEVYLELTFYSNDAPPVKRDMPRPSLHPYGSTASASTSSINGRHGSIATSGSISGMNLYIPPYLQGQARPPSAQPPPASNSFTELGLPPNHRQNQTLQAIGQQVYSGPSTTPLPPNSADTLTQSFNSMSLGQNHASRPLPAAGPSQAHLNPGHAAHRHSLGGAMDAPWSSMMPQAQNSAPVPHARPLSTSDTIPWQQQQQQGVNTYARTGPSPIPRPVSSTSYEPNCQPGYVHRASTPTPIPASLQPAGPPEQPRTHAHSFSGPSRPAFPPADPGYPHSSASPFPYAPSVSAPPNPNQGHYQIPVSSFAGLNGHQRSPSPLPPQAITQQPPGSYYQAPQSAYPSSQPIYEAQVPGSRSNTLPNPAQSVYQGHPAMNGSSPVPPPATYTQQSSSPPRDLQSPPPNAGGYIPWYQQTQPAAPVQSPAPAATNSYAPQAPPSQYNPYPQQNGQYTQAYSPVPPPIPDQRPVASLSAPAPPPPRQARQSLGYYPSDELYAIQRAVTPQAAQPPPWQQPTQPLQQQQQHIQPQYDPRQYSTSPSPLPLSPLSSVPPSVFSPPPPQPQPPYRAPSPVPPPQNGTVPSLWQAPPPAQQYPPSNPATYPPQPPPRQPSPAVYPPSSNGWHQPSTPSPGPSQERPVQSYIAAAAAPIPPARAPSPLPTQIGQDWKSYMRSLGTTPAPAPQQASQGQQGEWYTPPPSLPTSIQPPSGWKSTLPAQGGGEHKWQA